ncbi:MAG TPA: FAD-binding oxidoreductase [Candidatus Nitrosotalea sp.]|nr:FAD-binding oxidoreductase [Candidatus Nitrosotalea sp.]
MNRRSVLVRAGMTALASIFGSACTPSAPSGAPFRRVRPGDPSWPDARAWERLNRQTDGQLITVRSPLVACVRDPQGAVCAEFARWARNPYYLGDEVGLTQTLGWVDAWTSQPSVYAVAARRTADVVAAVNFARDNKLRLIVKGGGHSYLGTSSAPDSLLIWMRRMNAITVHDAFVGAGCAGRVAPRPAVTVEAGAIWMHVYDEVTTKGGRYVQGGGCLTVGVAGLIQSGGFGSFSKRFGLAAAGLLEAEIVTADGAVRIANACSNPDLFWGIKGGGGASLGVVTRLTLATRELPEFLGAVTTTIQAASDAAFRRLIGRVVGFYAEALFNPNWGEQISLRPDNRLDIRMVFQGLDRAQAEAVWRPFLEWVAASPNDFRILAAPRVVAVPARRFWDPAFLGRFPGIAVADDRPGAPEGNVLWAGDAGQAGQFLHGYQSMWLPAALLESRVQSRLADALFAASRHWGFSLHVNKGLAGAPADEVTAARDTAINPAVLGAFALAICGAEEPPAYPGVVGHEPDVPAARRHAAAIDGATKELRALVPDVGCYVSESNFFEVDWARAYWGPNYPRLLTVKDTYDPDGLFVVHHGVGSERWSADGFSRRA